MPLIGLIPVPGEAGAHNWVRDLPELSDDEKDAVLSRNPANLFGL